MHHPAEIYQLQIEKYRQSLSGLYKKRSRLGWIRFLIFILTLAIAYLVFTQFGLWGIAASLACLSVLLYVVSVDVRNNSDIRNQETILSINREELQILQHDYGERYDGQAYSPAHHDYAADLDLFGKASLYQWCHRAFTEQGRDLFAKNLLHPLPVNLIAERQEAVKELSPMLEWRQQLQSFASRASLTRGTENRTLSWVMEAEQHFRKKRWKILVNIYSVITIGSAIAAIAGYLPAGLFPFLYVIYFSVSLMLGRYTVTAYAQLTGIVKEMETLYQLVRWIEEKEFRGSLLNRIKADCRPGGENAYHQIRELKSILDRFDMRLNIAGLLLLNTFLLWDVRQMMSLNAWRKKNRSYLPAWFRLIAEAEVLNSLATLHFNHPAWTFPVFTDQHFSFRSTSLGHPLIPEDKRVNNDFSLAGTGQVALVTGSNMAGKSTFLRSIGVNIVLAQMGAPVCADSLTLSPVRLMSSMRVSDNLAENTSTFYAELKKLKEIIEAVKQKEKVFILLDEILRGTNSHDRHTGSEALIAQLVREKAVALLATHDLALAALEKSFPSAVENYHFDVQVEGEELFFDYRLREGVCTSLNASILMKKIGIEMEDG